MIDTLTKMSDQAPELAKQMQRMVSKVPTGFMEHQTKIISASLGLTTDQASMMKDEVLTLMDNQEEIIQYVKSMATQTIQFSQLDDPFEEMPLLNQALKLNPHNPQLLRRRGEIYRWKGEYAEALADFNHVIELQPDYDLAICRRGETYLLMRNYEAALADFEHALKLAPTDDWYYYQRGLLFLLTQKTEQAESDLAQAIRTAYQAYEEAPENWPNTFNLLFYYLGANQNDKAEHLCYQILDNLAIPYYFREAILLLDIFLCLFPNHVSAQSIRGLLEQPLMGKEVKT